jgi:DNA polymerase-3 subunit beta
MQFTVNQAELLARLSSVVKVVPSRPLQPIMGCIKLEAGDDSLTLSAIDGTREIKMTVPAAVVKPGAIALNGKQFADVIGKLSPVVLEFEVGGEGFGMAIRSDTGEYVLQGMAADSFPEFEPVEGQSLTLPLSLFVAGLKPVVGAASIDETKQVLTGLHLKVLSNNSIEIAATNGHRLATQQVAVGAVDSGFEVTVPRITLESLIQVAGKKDGELLIEYNKVQISFSLPEAKISSRLLEGQYPNYPVLIPKSFAINCVTNKAQLLTALDRIAAVGGKDTAVQLSYSTNSLTVSTPESPSGKGKEVLPATLSGNTLSVSFNTSYLADILKTIDTENVSIAMNTPTAPVVFAPEGDSGLLHLVMPIGPRG